MRSAILTLSLALALPLIPVAAHADAHDTCNQLRNTVYNSIPVMSRDLPFAALDCAAIDEIHLLVTSGVRYSDFQKNQRIEAVFRREGLIR